MYLDIIHDEKHEQMNIYVFIYTKGKQIFPTSMKIAHINKKIHGETLKKCEHHRESKKDQILVDRWKNDSGCWSYLEVEGSKEFSGCKEQTYWKLFYIKHS